LVSWINSNPFFPYRYLFVFHFKNPSAFKEDFWYRFLSTWIYGASWIFNGAWFYKAEHQIINYCMCCGQDPTEDFKKPLKLYATTELCSIFINVIVYLRVHCYKSKNHQSLNVNIQNNFQNIDKKYFHS